MPQKGRARLTGQYYTHRYLWHAAETLARQGRTQEEGGAISLLAAVLFVYFALEAYVNDIGPMVCPEEWADERAFFGGKGGDRYRGTLGKVLLVADRLQLPVDQARRPYQTVMMLDSRRDQLVHGRPEVIDQEVSFRGPEHLKNIDSALYSIADAVFVRRAFSDVEQLCDAIQGHAQAELGEHVVWSPRAFRGMMSHQGGSILEMPE